MRFGLDVGTNSIGWSVFETQNGEPVRLLAASSRIFSDGREPQKKEPLAVSCRIARGARVRRDRMIGRKKLLLKRLIELGLMPQDENARQALKSLNPYELRAKAVTKSVSAHELGRVLMNLTQRRGFKSNRKTDTKKDDKKDEKKTRADMDAFAKKLAESGLMLGQYLWQERLCKKLSTRARPGEELSTRREQYESEFEKIRSTQAGHHPSLSDEHWEEISHILFDQRQLREQEVGYCQVYFEQKERRAPKALPSFQKFRIAQNIVNLQIISPDRSSRRRLNVDERKMLARTLQTQKTMSFSKIRKLLKLDDGEVFNLESERKEKLEGNETAALLSNSKYFGKKWFDLSDDEQDTITLFLQGAEKTEEVIRTARQEWHVSEDQATNLATLTPEHFVKGYARFGKRALHGLIEKLTEQGISTTEAIQELRGKRGDNSMRQDRLPYYGAVIPESMIPSPKRGDGDTKHYGKINNPTVHIGLNQMRKLVNELMETYGTPDEIFLELARELKLNDEAKKGLATFQKNNQKLNDEAVEKMRESGLSPSDDYIKRYKLWLELSKDDVNDRCCPYSGKKISMEMLWSDAVEVEHILPESKTFDSSMKNLTVAFKEANRIKGNRAPDEAFNTPSSPYPYQDMLERVQRSAMSKHKKGKFDPDAMKKFSDDPENGFIARQLTDTQYLAKVASKYLQSLFPGDEVERRKHVHVLPGQLTARIRHQWGLNSILAPDNAPDNEKEKKNRDDHRHHAIDAIVIACTDRSMLMKASRASGQNYKGEVKFEPPWEREQFRRDVADVIGKAIVSHKPDHGIQANLHEGTYYGIIKEEHKNDYERENDYNVVTRGDFRGHFAEVTPDKLAKKIDLIRDPVIRKELETELANVASTEDITRIVDAYAKRKGIRHIRLLKKEATVLPITHTSTSGQVFEKGVVPGEIHHIAFWRVPNNWSRDKDIWPLEFHPLAFDKNIIWAGCNFFYANKFKNDPNALKPHPAAKLVSKVHKGDVFLAVNEDTQREEVYKIVGLQPSYPNFRFEWKLHADGRKSESTGKKFLSFNKMKKLKARKVFITPAGKIHDSGSMF